MHLCQSPRLLPAGVMALLISCAASAQITVTATAATTLRVVAEGIIDTLPQGSNAAAVSLYAYESYHCPFFQVTDTEASTVTSLDTSDPSRIHFEVHERGLIHDQCGWLTSFDTGPNLIRLDFTTATPVSGVLVVACRALAPVGGITWGAGATLDIGNNGTLEFDTSTGPPALSSIAMQLLAGTTSVLVRTETWGWGAANPPNWDYAYVDLRLTFVPDAPCSVESFGSPCGGLTMTALPTVLGVEYQASGLGPNGLGVIAFGASLPVPVALPFAPGCDLLVDLGVLGLHVADGAGNVNAFQGLSLPPMPAQVSLSMQFGGLMANGSVPTSNGIRLDCPPN